MAEAKNRIELENIDTGEVVTVRWTTGGYTKAAQLLGEWFANRTLRQEALRFDTPFQMIVTAYLAARRKGLAGTEGYGDPTFQQVVDFFDVWEPVFVDDGDEGGGEAPFDTGATS